MSTDSILRCRSPRVFVSIGPVPPRTPGRTDAQVPTLLDDGPARYARLPHLYFYTDDAARDAAFGFVDIEVSVQRLGGRYDVEIYCSADGYQSGSGSADGVPLRIDFCAGDRIAGSIAWPFPDVRSGTSDPLTFRTRLDIGGADFEAIDTLVVPGATAICHIDLDD